MISETLYDDGTRQWVFIGRDPTKPDQVVDTNQYVILHDGRAAVLDPGGTEVFPTVVEAVARVVPVGDIEVLFGSHQDPDIISSLPLWTAIVPGVRVFVPEIWVGFLSHFAGDAELEGIPDRGGPLPLAGSRDLTLVPAHYLHSSGNFSVWDPRARTLFSGDIGAALLPDDDVTVRVEDFDAHVKYMEGFHRRWMPSERAKQDWIERVRRLDPVRLCPQHGAIFEGEHVARFLQWFSDLPVGAAVR
jgi:flavorubredoxin